MKALPIFALILVLAFGASGPLFQEFIFDSAPFSSCHASTVVELSNGGLMAAWFGGKQEAASDVAIWGSRRAGGHWSAPVELVREPHTPCWNPVLFHTHDGRLWLYYKFGTSPEVWSAGRLFSADDGKTWSRPEHLPAGLYGPIRAKPLVLPGGTIVSGTSVESYRSWAAWIERSTNGGKTWVRIGPITVPPGAGAALQSDSEDTYGIIQPSLVALGKRHLRLYARSTSLIGRICVADSFDAGITWSPARPLDLPNPNSGIDAVALRDGRVVLVFNNSSTKRTPLNLAVSRDGEHFQVFETLEDQPGEYSYPALIQSKDGDLQITYTWNRKKIRYARLPFSAIPQ